MAQDEYLMGDLNRTMAKKMADKYDHALEKTLREWMASKLPDNSDITNESSFFQLLKTGVVLCQLANSLSPGAVKRIHTTSLVFKQMENISNFLSACKRLGLSDSERFETVDLFENKNMTAVLMCLNAVKLLTDKGATISESSTSTSSSNVVLSRKTLSSSTNSSPSVNSSPSKGNLPGSGSPRSSLQFSGSPRLKPQLAPRSATPTPTPTSHFPSNYSRPSSPTCSSFPPPSSPSKSPVKSPLSPPKTPPRTPPRSLTKSPTITTPTKSPLTTPTKSPTKSPTRSPPKSPSSNFSNLAPSANELELAVPSLEDDVRTKEQFKYDYELEKSIKKWISEVRKESFPTDVTFSEAIKSGELLCSLVNAIEPGTIQKIHKTKIGYHHIENIKSYLSACEQKFKMRPEDNFQTSDLYNEKNMTLVVQQIQAMARHVGRMYPDLPTLEVTHSKNLWATALSTNANLLEELSAVDDDFVPTPNQEQLLIWANSHLADTKYGEMENFGKDLRSGVKISKLLEIVSGTSPGGIVKEPTTLWHYMQNASLIFRFLNTQFEGEVPESCTSADIIYGRQQQIARLLEFIRSKWDMSLYFEDALDVEHEDEGVAAALSYLQAMSTDSSGHQRLEMCYDLIDELLKKKEEGEGEEERDMEEEMKREEREKKKEEMKREEKRREEERKKEKEEKRKREEEEREKKKKEEEERKRKEEEERKWKKEEEERKKKEEGDKKKKEVEEKKKKKKEVKEEKKKEKKEKKEKVKKEKTEKKEKEKESRKSRKEERECRKSGRKEEKEERGEGNFLLTPRGISPSSSSSFTTSSSSRKSHKSPRKRERKEEKEREEKEREEFERKEREEVEREREEKEKEKEKVIHRGLPPKKKKLEERSASKEPKEPKETKEIKEIKETKEIKEINETKKKELPSTKDMPSTKDLLALQKKMKDAQNSVRKRIAMELLETETNYVKNISALNSEVVQHLQGAISDSDIRAMFGNLPDLVKYHGNFVELLKKRMESWKDCTVVSDIFLKECPFLPEYQGYLTNFHRANLYCKYFMWKSPKVNDLLSAFKNKRRKTTGLSLEDFLVLPVQRVPRYALLLREIQKYTAKSDPEHEEVGKAIKYVQSTLSTVNSTIDKQETKLCSMLNNVDSAVEGFTSFLKDAMEKGKGVLVEGELLLVKVQGKKKSGPKGSGLAGIDKGMRFYCYAFVDQILLCLPHEDDQSTRASVGGKFGIEKKPYELLSAIPVEMIKDLSLNFDKKKPNRFLIEFTSEESWILEADSFEKCSFWTLNLEHCRMLAVKSKE